MIEDPVGGRMLSLAIAEMEEEKIGGCYTRAFAGRNTREGI